MVYTDCKQQKRLAMIRAHRERLRRTALRNEFASSEAEWKCPSCGEGADV